jgi:hypothetical protein
MTETGAIAYEDEQLPWEIIGLWHSLCSSLKLNVSGIAVYLLPLLQIYSCFLFDAWLFIRFFASTSL